MEKPRTSWPLVALALALGLFFFLDAVQTLLTLDAPLARASRTVGSWLGTPAWVTTLTPVGAVLQAACGLLLVVLPFGLLTPTFRMVGFVTTLVVWSVVSVWNLFVVRTPLEPSALAWGRDLVLALALGAALWPLRPRKAR